LIKISNELSRNFQDFQDESFLLLATDEGDDNNLQFVCIRKTATTALWFSSFKILKVFRQILVSASREKGNQ
jgi:hypothetical protein